MASEASDEGPTVCQWIGCIGNGTRHLGPHKNQWHEDQRMQQYVPPARPPPAEQPPPRAHTPATMGVKEVRQAVARLFCIVDEGERDGEVWWVVYMAGARVFGSTDEAAADKFKHDLHVSVLRTLGLLP